MPDDEGTAVGAQGPAGQDIEAPLLPSLQAPCRRHHRGYLPGLLHGRSFNTNIQF